MKRLLLVLVVLGAVVLGLALVGSTLLEKALVASLETMVPRLAKAPVSVGGARLTLTGGSGEIRAFALGNPEGFRSESSIRVDRLRLDLIPASLLSGKVIVEELVIEGPEITYEARLGGSNLGAILQNVESQLGGESAAPESEGRRFEFRRIAIVNGKALVLAPQLDRQGIEVVLPTIEITDIGTSEEGATLGNALARVLASIDKEMLAVALSSGSDVGRQLREVGESVRDRAGSALETLRRSREDEGD